jgi:hypothetical protein
VTGKKPKHSRFAVRTGDYAAMAGHHTLQSKKKGRFEQGGVLKIKAGKMA